VPEVSLALTHPCNKSVSSVTLLCLKHRLHRDHAPLVHLYWLFTCGSPFGSLLLSCTNREDTFCRQWSLHFNIPRTSCLLTRFSALAFVQYLVFKELGRAFQLLWLIVTVIISDYDYKVSHTNIIVNRFFHKIINFFEVLIL
jgi:hypothetical protein